MLFYNNIVVMFTVSSSVFRRETEKNVSRTVVFITRSSRYASLHFATRTDVGLKVSTKKLSNLLSSNLILYHLYIRILRRFHQLIRVVVE